MSNIHAPYDHEGFIQLGPFNPSDLNPDGTFSSDRFFSRLRRKHGYSMRLPNLQPKEPDHDTPATPRITRMPSMF